MLLFLPLAFLLVHDCSGQFGNAKSVTAQAVQMINEYRQSVANGTAFNMSGYLPSTVSMFQLKADDKLTLAALETVFTCNLSNPSVPPGESFNGYNISYYPSSLNASTMFNIALAKWEEEPIRYGIGDSVVYSNTKLKEWANMVYYKSTEVGCYYNLCNTSRSIMHAIACYFNMKPQWNQQLYNPTQGVDGCNLDETCRGQLPGSTCVKTNGKGMYAGLCDPEENTFSTSTAASTAATTAASTAGSSSASPTTPVKSTLSTKATSGSTPSTKATSGSTPSTKATSGSTPSTKATSGSTPSTKATSGSTQATSGSTPSTKATSGSTPSTKATSGTTPSTKATGSTMASGTTATPGPTTTPGTPLSMTEAVRDKIINMHNYRRSRLAQGLVPNGTSGKKLPQGTDIAQMQYNHTLENAAQKYANTCPTGISPVSSREGMGEIYQTLPSNTLTLMDAIEMALKASWHPIMVIGFDPNLEFTDTTLHLSTAPLMFTQMAWGATYQVGCGATRCSDNTTVICRYNPSGNIPGQTLYTAGSTCSACPSDCTTAYLYKGLCIMSSS
ncbi:hypothetical protein V3C99_006068 [Haemonchus contortus]